MPLEKRRIMRPLSASVTTRVGREGWAFYIWIKEMLKFRRKSGRNSIVLLRYELELLWDIAGSYMDAPFCQASFSVLVLR